jgi:hypothetical protein
MQHHIQQADNDAIANILQPMPPAAPGQSLSTLSPSNSQSFGPLTPTHCSAKLRLHSGGQTSPFRNPNMIMYSTHETDLCHGDVCQRYCKRHAAQHCRHIRAACLTESCAKTDWQQVFALIDIPALGDRRPSHLMNEMLALLPTGSNKDESLFPGLFLHKLHTLMRDPLAATDYQTATAMAKYVIWWVTSPHHHQRWTLSPKH